MRIEKMPTTKMRQKGSIIAMLNKGWLIINV
jgi:hypothetical protein